MIILPLPTYGRGHFFRAAAMPLSRPVDRPHLTTPAGVQFTMADRSKLIRCIVQSSTLCKLARHEIAMADYEPVFLAHQEEIELIASRKYDAARVLYVPFEITPSDVVLYRTRT